MKVTITDNVDTNGVQNSCNNYTRCIGRMHVQIGCRSNVICIKGHLLGETTTLQKLQHGVRLVI